MKIMIGLNSQMVREVAYEVYLLECFNLGVLLNQFLLYFVTVPPIQSLNSVSPFSHKKEGRKAAEVLGYDERKWNKGKDTKVMKKYWDDLTDEEQIAATVLGYDDEMWDQS
eukprot:CAMPEP_0203713738 /NCGR_PEP_ID=MMETSP0091-20130426/70717_1 /ASSEMBLY_ACC=CAM_ASM_001089 /TAXON_ID=426623 /ORGANISM="Chaetoceros affinis, Strain CCMP159" /LENGTH=110 /DNA_ID=CAMNT_0050591773 /DNA_START=448 /DNA_END=781 /DNA_ORIENTATION=-